MEEELIAEEAVRRYTVEIIVFSYEEDVSDRLRGLPPR